jgi:hypothetical protein
MRARSGRRMKRPSFDCHARSRPGAVIHLLGSALGLAVACSLLALNVSGAASASAAVSRNLPLHTLPTAQSARFPNGLAQAVERSLGRGARRLSQTTQAASWSQAQLVADPGAGVDSFSYSVALSSDGIVALIGAPDTTVGGNDLAGEAYFFTRSGNSWSEAQAVPDPAGAGDDRFGLSVALSADGGVALIGGAAEPYFFTHAGASWSQAQAVPISGTSGYFGYSVALSGDGSTALIGAPSTNVGGKLDAGEVYFFSRSGNSWSQAQVVSDPAGAADDEFGFSVALSSDGTVALIGADQYGFSGGGFAYFFSRSGNSWSQAQAVPDPAGAADDAFGWSVALSSDGSVGLIGAINTNVGGTPCVGEAYVFTRSGASWSQAQAIPDPSGTECDQFGFSVALSSDGSIALLGAPGNSPAEAYFFTRSGPSWCQAQAVPDPVQTGDHYFGFSGALSSDGSVALIGDPMLRDVGGEASFFTGSGSGCPPVAPPPTPSTLALDKLNAPTFVLGSETTAQLFSFTDSPPIEDPSDLGVSIDWGDGWTSLGSVSADYDAHDVPTVYFATGTHTYSSLGVYTVTASVRAPGTNVLTETLQVTVANVVPVPLEVVRGQLFKGTIALFAYPLQSGVAVPASSFTATVDWGDGTSTPATVVASSIASGMAGSAAFEIRAQHTYDTTDVNDYTVSIQPAGSNTVSATARVAVYSLHPTAFFVASPDNPAHHTIGLLYPREPLPSQLKIREFRWDFGDGATVVDNPTMQRLYADVLQRLDADPGNIALRSIAIDLGILPTDARGGIAGVGALSDATVRQTVGIWQAYFPQHIVPHLYDYYTTPNNGTLDVTLTTTDYGGPPPSQYHEVLHVSTDCQGFWGGLLGTLFGSWGCAVYDGIAAQFGPHRLPDYVALNLSKQLSGSISKSLGLTGGISLVLTHGSIRSFPVGAGDSVFVSVYLSGGRSISLFPATVGWGWVGTPDPGNTPSDDTIVGRFVDGLDVFSGFQLGFGFNAVYSPSTGLAGEEYFPETFAVGALAGVSCAGSLNGISDGLWTLLQALYRTYSQAPPKNGNIVDKDLTQLVKLTSGTAADLGAAAWDALSHCVSFEPSRG